MPNVIVDGLIGLQVRPDGTISVRAMVPVNPVSAVSVMVELTAMFSGVVSDVAAMVKSLIVNVTVVLWTSRPLVPVMVAL